LALSARTRGRPSATDLQEHLFGAGRSLVRTWGQRDTLFVYAADTHWADVVAARTVWSGGGRRFGIPPQALVDRARRTLLAAKKPLTRSDFFELVPRKLVNDWKRQMKVDETAALRFAAGRLFWKLAHHGDACLAEKAGPEQSYAARKHWFQGLEWPRKLDGHASATRLAESYLSTFAPATPADVGHFFGARVADVKRWLAELDVVPVECGQRPGLVALARDAQALRSKPPRRLAEWPVRLLPLWDASLMAHKDKRWLTPEVADEKRVWRKAALVAATVIARGRVVANWSPAVRRGKLQVEVEPLSSWRASRHLASVKREARSVAAHLGVDAGDVSVPS